MGVARSRRGEMAWALLSPVILILGLTLAVMSVEWPHRFGRGLDVSAVSYTHLTLPTILRV